MGTLKGFPNPPALWLRRAKPASAYAFDLRPLCSRLRALCFYSKEQMYSAMSASTVMVKPLLPGTRNSVLAA